MYEKIIMASLLTINLTENRILDNDPKVSFPSEIWQQDSSICDVKYSLTLFLFSLLGNNYIFFSLFCLKDFFCVSCFEILYICVWIWVLFSFIHFKMNSFVSLKSPGNFFLYLIAESHPFVFSLLLIGILLHRLLWTFAQHWIPSCKLNFGFIEIITTLPYKHEVQDS